MLGWISGWSNNTPEQSTGIKPTVTESAITPAENITISSNPISPPLNGRIIDNENGYSSLVISIDNYIPSINDMEDKKIENDLFDDIIIPDSPPIIISSQSHSREHSRMFSLCKKLNPDRKWPHTSLPASDR
jgi:hypothetical protein